VLTPLVATNGLMLTELIIGGPGVGVAVRVGVDVGVGVLGGVMLVSGISTARTCMLVEMPALQSFSVLSSVGTL
jgi:hypothetical protein